MYIPILDETATVGDWKRAIEEAYKRHSHSVPPAKPCPSCGACPTCGRQAQPSITYTYGNNINESL